YGPRQALSNPYTGVLAIFAARYLNGRPPLIFEDGAQQRDFVHVGDVTRACRLALEGPARDVALNIGSGQPRTVLAVAEAVGAALGLDHIEPAITGEYRMGDIRHCFGDIGAARRLLDFQPQTDFTAGIQELATWLHDQQAEDHSEAAHGELRRHGLKIARQATAA
ncbi:MAG: NAD-dependent epimerase/dehydratase family protein, partial [Planctomycetota bacterium]